MGFAKRDTWHPTQADLDGLEANLQQISNLVAENWPHTIPIRIDHPERYFRQYVPVLRKGKQFIYVNAFCSDVPLPDWRQHVVMISDGGSCCWQASYDPIDGKFTQLRINGVA